MKHLGDITKISGYEAPVVDVIIGGSPCQDLSLAGKRAGLAGARSGLYMEQIRIIKEMREADGLRGNTDVDVRPRYMVWENVPGAFSTNGGKDFAAVLEEAIRVAEPEAPNVDVPQKGWPTSGCLFDEMGKWSVAWRVLDAQFWGVPQRRRRIALIADFGGLSASEILFVRKGVSGNIEPGKQKWKKTSGNAGDSTGGAVPFDGRCAVFNGANITSPINKTNPQPGDPCHTLTDDNRNWIVLPALNEKLLFENHSQDARYKGPLEVSPMLSAQLGTGGNNTPLVMETATFADVASTLRSGAGAPKHLSDFGGRLVSQHGIVRKLTPLECERLQGFPDKWTDIGEWVDSKGKKHKEADSPRYKALGNSIALPPWKWVLKRLCACYERDATMASLFDGIGGFPYIWEQLNGKGSCLWASEIEEFPMAVTKQRFSKTREELL